MSATFIPTPPAADEWPAPPAAEAFYGIAGDWVDLIEPETESDPAGLLLNFLIITGAMFGKDGFAVADGSIHCPSDFLLVVGDSAISRKGTSTRRVRNTIDILNPQFFADHMISGLSSGEGLIQHMQDQNQLGISNFVGYMGEFAGLIACAKREGNIISATLRNAWDRERLNTLTKKDPLSCSDYTLALIAHITADELLNSISSTELVNGFINRFLIAKVRRSKLLPEGGTDVNTSQVIARLKAALRCAENRGRLHRNEAAKEVWKDAYEKLANPSAGLKGALCARGDAHMLRLSLIYALLDGAAEVQPQHVQAAMAVWDYVERSVASVFSSRLGDPHAERILDSMASGPKTLSELHAAFANHKSSEWLTVKIAEMMKKGLITQTLKDCDRKKVTAWDRKRV